MPFNIIHVASEYQEIHPYGVVNIDNVKNQYYNDEKIAIIYASARRIM